MEINLTGNALNHPANMSLKAELAWDYFEMNNGGWIAVQAGDGEIIVTDESGDLENGFVCPDEDAFVGWLHESAQDHIDRGEGTAEFLMAANWIDPRLLSDASQRDVIISAVRNVLNADDEKRKELF